MITIKLTGGPRVTFANSQQSLFRVADMQRLGDFAVSTVKQRAMRGLGSDGTAMPPLKASRLETVKTGPKTVSFRRTGYAAWKAKHGLQPVRDLIGTGEQGGHMWDNFTVRSVTEQLVRMAFTSKHQREKALANEKRAPFLSFSAADQTKIAAEAARLFGINVRSLGVTQAIAILRRRKAA